LRERGHAAVYACFQDIGQTSFGCALWQNALIQYLSCTETFGIVKQIY
jgi:hypothetical protein